MYHESDEGGLPASASERQAGQTLIETIVAIFLLTLALGGGLALVIFAISRSSLSVNQIIATNLAREGVDVVRMMRDSNWLASDVRGGAWDLASCADIGGSLCYPRAYQAVPPTNNFNLAVGNYEAAFNDASKTWSLDTADNYNLYLQANGTYNHTPNGSSQFARKVRISRNTAAPYTGSNSNWELVVVSTVLWRDKNCTSFLGTVNIENVSTTCKVVVEERLTNWKDYK
jgi:hypothetical protein